MSDRDIPRETAVVIIKTKSNLDKVVEEINEAFNSFDVAEDGSEEYRADGWSIETFVDYLRFRYKHWSIDWDTSPDAEMELTGY